MQERFFVVALLLVREGLVISASGEYESKHDCKLSIERKMALDQSRCLVSVWLWDI